MYTVDFDKDPYFACLCMSLSERTQLELCCVLEVAGWIVRFMVRASIGPASGSRYMA